MKRGAGFVNVPLNKCMPILQAMSSKARYMTANNIEFSKEDGSAHSAYVIRIPKNNRLYKHILTDEAILSYLNEAKGFSDSSTNDLMNIWDEENNRMTASLGMEATVEADRLPGLLTYLTDAHGAKLRVSLDVLEAKKEELGIDLTLDYNDGLGIEESESGLAQVEITIANPEIQQVVQKQADPVAETAEQTEQTVVGAIEQTQPSPELIEKEANLLLQQQHFALQKKMFKLYRLILLGRKKMEMGGVFKNGETTPWGNIELSFCQPVRLVKINIPDGSTQKQTWLNRLSDKRMQSYVTTDAIFIYSTDFLTVMPIAHKVESVTGITANEYYDDALAITDKGVVISKHVLDIHSELEEFSSGGGIKIKGITATSSEIEKAVRLKSAIVAAKMNLKDAVKYERTVLRNREEMKEVIPYAQKKVAEAEQELQKALRAWESEYGQKHTLANGGHPNSDLIEMPADLQKLYRQLYEKEQQLTELINKPENIKRPRHLVDKDLWGEIQAIRAEIEEYEDKYAAGGNIPQSPIDTGKIYTAADAREHKKNWNNDYLHTDPGKIYQANHSPAVQQFYIKGKPVNRIFTGNKSGSINDLGRMLWEIMFADEPQAVEHIKNQAVQQFVLNSNNCYSTRPYSNPYKYWSAEGASEKQVDELINAIYSIQSANDITYRISDRTQEQYRNVYEEGGVLYNSHGNPMSWNEFIQIEVRERENYSIKEVKGWASKYGIKPETMVIWVTKDPKQALFYIAQAQSYNDVKNLTLAEFEQKWGVSSSSLYTYSPEDGFVIEESNDGDGGFLFVLKETKENGGGFRNQNLLTKGGNLCPVGTQIQTLLFKRSDFTEAQAKAWAKAHDFKYGSIDTTANHYRMRQHEPSKFKLGSFRTIEITTGIKAVIGCPKKTDNAVIALNAGGHVKEKWRNEWTQKAQKKLLGKTVVHARFIKPEEAEDMDWFPDVTQFTAVIQLSDGSVIYPSADDEGNNGGFFAFVGEDTVNYETKLKQLVGLKITQAFYDQRYANIAQWGKVGLTIQFGTAQKPFTVAIVAQSDTEGNDAGAVFMQTRTDDLGFPTI